MKIALTGGTGFIGRYLLRNLTQNGHRLNAWHRSETSIDNLRDDAVDWIPGNLDSCETATQLVNDCDAVIHNAFWKPGAKFQGEEGNIVKFVETNLIGTLKLIEAAIEAQVPKFIFVSTCAVHDVILTDRKLDEAHPLWPKSHYGAHKAAIEKFIHSYGLGHDVDICAIRPTGVYGLHHEPQRSKWFDLVQAVVAGQRVRCEKGGKEVHAGDVAEAIRLLIGSNNTKGESFSCYDRYISQHEVATLAKQISGSDAEIDGNITRPKNEIDNSKIRRIGMNFGGSDRLRQTIEQLVEVVKR